MSKMKELLLQQQVEGETLRDRVVELARRQMIWEEEEAARAELLDRFGDLDAEERDERAAERRRSHPDPAWR